MACSKRMQADCDPGARQPAAEKRSIGAWFGRRAYGLEALASRCRQRRKGAEYSAVGKGIVNRGVVNARVRAVS
jgi:hypothetical protein